MAKASHFFKQKISVYFGNKNSFSSGRRDNSLGLSQATQIDIALYINALEQVL